MAVTSHWQVLAQLFADRMLNGVLQGIVLAVFGWVIVRAARRQNAGTRFAVWFSTMLAVAAFPFFGSMGSRPAGTLANAPHPALHLPQSWAVAIVVIWAVIASVGLAKIGFGFWQLCKLRRESTVIDNSSLDSVLRSTLDEFGCARSAVLCTSDRVRVPTVIGFTKPAIALPHWALRDLSTDELNAVLLHELAHLRRRDDWTNLIQEILRALFFFHPALWWIGRGLSIEREMACDDFVLATTSSPRAYAQCLVSVAEKSFLRRGLALAQAVAGRMHETTRRVLRILDADRPVATKVSKPALSIVAAFAVVCLVSLPHVPRLVAFDEIAPSSSATASAVVSTAGAGPKMIRAALHSRVDAAQTPASVIHSRAVRLPSRNIRNSDAAPTIGASAKMAARQNNSPRSINVSDSNAVDDANYPQSMLLVIHTEEIDSNGRIWSISVMRLTVFHPADRHVLDRQLQKGIIPKTT
jgi:beta-lactamase regulating signal transducer with metallopeptidase domain